MTLKLDVTTQKAETEQQAMSTFEGFDYPADPNPEPDSPGDNYAD